MHSSKLLLSVLLQNTLPLFATHFFGHVLCNITLGLCLCCLWLTQSSVLDFLKEAALLIRDIPNPQKAAARLADAALNRGSNDNISCVVIRFQFD